MTIAASEVRSWFVQKFKTGKHPSEENLRSFAHFLNRVASNPTCEPSQVPYDLGEYRKAVRLLHEIVPKFSAISQRNLASDETRFGCDSEFAQIERRRLQRFQALNTALQSAPLYAPIKKRTSRWHSTAECIAGFVQNALQSTGRNRVDFTTATSKPVAITVLALERIGSAQDAATVAKHFARRKRKSGTKVIMRLSGEI